MPQIGDTYITEIDIYDTDMEAFIEAKQTNQSARPEDFEVYIGKRDLIHFYNGLQFLEWIDNGQAQNVWIED